MRGGERHRLGESALESGSCVGERDADWERAHLRVEGNDWRRGGRHRLEEGALNKARGVKIFTDLERAHLIGRDVGRKTPTGRERT